MIEITEGNVNYVIERVKASGKECSHDEAIRILTEFADIKGDIDDILDAWEDSPGY